MAHCNFVRTFANKKYWLLREKGDHISHCSQYVSVNTYITIETCTREFACLGVFALEIVRFAETKKRRVQREYLTPTGKIRTLYLSVNAYKVIRLIVRARGCSFHFVRRLDEFGPQER